MWQRHKKLSTYLSKIERTVNSLDNVQVELYREDRVSSTDVVLRIRIRFAKRYLLALNEAVYVEDDQIEHRRYRYHFQDQDNNLIFRYDAAPHFPALPSFPHHKHLPDKVIAVEKPSVIDAIQEAIGFVA